MSLSGLHIKAQLRQVSLTAIRHSSTFSSVSHNYCRRERKIEPHLPLLRCLSLLAHRPLGLPSDAPSAFLQATQAQIPSSWHPKMASSTVCRLGRKGVSYLPRSCYAQLLSACWMPVFDPVHAYDPETSHLPCLRGSPNDGVSGENSPSSHQVAHHPPLEECKAVDPINPSITYRRQ